jgi:hypothetical protein
LLFIKVLPVRPVKKMIPVNLVRTVCIIFINGLSW